MASPFAKFAVPKEMIDKTYSAIEMARDTGKLKRGINEATKAIERGSAKLVAVAEDVNPPEIVAHIPLLSEEKDIPFVFVTSKIELGKASGIDVPTSAVAILEAGNAKDVVSDIARHLKELRKGKIEEKKPEAPKAEEKKEEATKVEEKKEEKPKKEKKPRAKKEKKE
jgi:large subunit ribosomal protein L7Ae